MTAVKSGLMIIDQHRAHIRVLYDRYRKQMEGSNGQSQGPLFSRNATVAAVRRVLCWSI